MIPSGYSRVARSYSETEEGLMIPPSCMAYVAVFIALAFKYILIELSASSEPSQVAWGCSTLEMLG